MWGARPVSSLLVNRFGSRPVVMLGGLVCGVAMVSASFGNSIVYLYFFIGVIGASPSVCEGLLGLGKVCTVFKSFQNLLHLQRADEMLVGGGVKRGGGARGFCLGSRGALRAPRGHPRPGWVIKTDLSLIPTEDGRPGPSEPLPRCGLSLNLNASLTIISKYFLTKRPLANGLSMAGSPVFLCVLAPANQYLLDRFGWRGSLLILGGLMLNCCVAGALMRPVVLPRGPEKGEELPNLCTKPKTSCTNKARKFLDLTFFKDRGFVIYLIGNVIYIFGAYAPIMFLSAYAIKQGVDEYSAAYLLSIMSFVDMFVRPGTGLLAGTKWIRPRIQYFFGFAMVFNGTCHLLCPLVRSYAYLVVYAVFLGVGFGMVFALIFECLMDLMGNERFPSAVGLVTIIECFPILVGPPTAGLLVDLYGDYKYLYFMCGGVLVTAGVFILVMNVFNYRMLEKEKEKSTETETEKPTALRELSPTQLAAENPEKVSAPEASKE
ncbi:Monocarboxylate transporter 2 [Liparis tanakae]|uniref:Monocarboxylate transporter 2 n=1 Tax=Liparis tanakae TaxID=230148 RepID=A0A4Z2FE65_9TELE|nr:Monocarboxylate transporter 2 [Liparis tanakae]